MTDSTHPHHIGNSSVAQELEQNTQQVLQFALAQYQSGQIKVAKDAYEAVLEILPNQAAANHQLGLIALGAGQASSALAYFKTALKSRPQQEEYWSSYIETLLKTGESNGAQIVLEMGKRHDLQSGALERPITQLQPNAHKGKIEKKVRSNVKSIHNPGLGKKATGKEKSPSPSPAQINTVLTLFARGRISETQKLAQSLSVRFPQHGFAWKVLGAVYEAQSQFEEAFLCMCKATRLLPDDAEALLNLGSFLFKQSKFDDAEAILHRAIALKPDSTEALSTLGATLLKQGHFIEAENRLNEALLLKPNFAPAHVNLGTTLLSQSRVPEAAKAYQRAQEIEPLHATAHSNLLFCLSHDVGVLPDQLFAAHIAFGAQFEVPLRSGWQAHNNNKDTTRCLQVGFVSADLYDHAIASFLEPILVCLTKRQDLSLHAYYTDTIEDLLTQRLRTYFSQWHAVAALSDGQLADKIRADGIDILIDLSGHTGKNRLLTFARKPAPIQASWMGYPGTTGLQAMDYYICDKFFAPPAEIGWQFTEKMIYLPTSSVFQPDAAAPQVNPLPAIENGYITFGSFNRDNKLNDGVIKLFALVLLGNPSARLVMAGINPKNQSDFAARFASAGIHEDRLTFYPRNNMHDYLKLHHLVDICLDTFPYGGGTTTFHAACMGVPTVTLAGETAASRSGASILGRLGLIDFVATSIENFVEISCKLSGEVNALALTRESMRARIYDSGIGQPELLCTNIGMALRTAWQRWCSGSPTETIEITS